MFGNKSSRRYVCALVASVCVFAAYATPSLAQTTRGKSGSCLDGIEAVMRDFQARYYEIAKNNPDLARNVADWPPCCPTEQAPAFPPDGYYDPALDGNPAFAVELVKALQAMLCSASSTPTERMLILEYFNDDGPLQPQDDCGVRPSATPLGQIMGGECDPVTMDTYCVVFQAIKEMVGRMNRIRTTESGSHEYMKVQRGTGQIKGAFGWCNDGSSYHCDILPSEIPLCQQGFALCYTGTGGNELSQSLDALDKAYNAVSCVWDNYAAWGQNDGPPSVSDRTQLETSGTDGQTEHCVTPWARSRWIVATNGYAVNRLDIPAVPGKVFFKVSTQSGGPDSPYRDGDIVGLPVTLCEFVSRGGANQWICYPEEDMAPPANGKLTVGFGSTGQPRLFLGHEDHDNSCDAPTDHPEFFDLPGSNGARGWDMLGVAGLLSPDFNNEPERGRDCGSGCTSCDEEKPRAQLGSIDLSWSLGKRPDETSGGYVALRVKNIVMQDDVNPPVWDNVVSPNRLVRNIKVKSNGYSSTRDTATGKLTSFVAETERAKIEVTGTSAQSPPYQTTIVVSTRDVLNGAYDQMRGRSTTVLEQSVEGSGSSTQHVVRVTQDVTGGVTRSWEYRLIGDTWKLREGFTDQNFTTALRSEEQQQTLSNVGGVDFRTTVRRTRNSDNSICSEETTLEQLFAWGWETVQRSRPGEPAEIFVFYQNTNFPSSLSRLQSHITPSGFWTIYEYNDNGELTKVVSQFQDSVYGSAEASNRVEEFLTYTGLDLDDDGLFVDVIKEHRVTLLGVVIERSLDAWISPAAYAVHYSFRCAHPEQVSSVAAYVYNQIANDAWRTSGDSVSRTETDTAPSAATWSWGKSDYTRTDRSDGSVSESLHLPWTAQWPFGTLPVGGVRQEGDWLTRVHTGVYQDEQSGFRVLSRQLSYQRGESGVVTESKAYDLSDPTQGANGVLVNRTVVRTFDARGRALVTAYALDDAHQSTEPQEIVTYGCCGVDSRTDRDGILTTYTYDALGRAYRVTHSVAAGQTMTTESVLDADGRSVEERRYPVGSSSFDTVAHSTYNTAGRLTQSTDALGNMTTYTVNYLSSGGYPSGVETVTTSPVPGTGLAAPVVKQVVYPDGQVRYSAGNAAVARSFVYGVVPAAGVWPTMTYVTECAGDVNPASCTQWVRSWTDPLGRQRLTEYPGVGTNPGPAAETRYHPSGQAVWRIDPDGVSVLSYSGNGLSDAERLGLTIPTAVQPYFAANWSLSVQDVDQDGAIGFSGNDRITLTSTVLVDRSPTPFGGQNPPPVKVRRSETRVWTTAGDAATVYLVSTQDQSLDGVWSWQTADGKTSASEIVVNASTATRTSTSISPTGAKQIGISVYGREQSVESRGPANEFLRKSTTAYDSRGRVISTTLIADPNNAALNATTTLAYDTADRVLTQTSPEPNAAAPYVGTLTTTFTYDNLGRVTNVNVGAGRDTQTKYTVRGEVQEVSGYEANPVRYVYDTLGRLKELHTFKVGPAGSSPWTGEAVTTWNYDSKRGWLTSKVYADGHGPSYEYSAAGRLLARHSQRDGSNIIDTTYGYATAGELATIDYSDDTPDVEMEHDRLGRLQQVIDSAGKRTITYDDPGRVLSEIIDFNTSGASNHLAGVRVDNGYDSLGRRDLLTTSVGAGGDPGISSLSRSVGYGYDSQWRIANLVKDNVKVVYGYHEPTGQVARTEYRDAANSNTLKAFGDRTFDKLGRLTSIHWKRPVDQLILLMDFVYDVYGRRVERADTKGLELRWHYTYDNLGQLVLATRQFDQACPNQPGPYMPGDVFAYTYDDIGNRTKISEGGDTLAADLYDSAYTTNSLNQYLTRSVSSNIEVAGIGSLFPDDLQTFLINGTTAWKCHGMYHRRVLGNDNSTAPSATTISISEIPGQPPFAYDVFLPETPETFAYDLDGNLTQDGVWDYEWDAENRLKAASMRPEAAEAVLGNGGTWVRLEFGYDWMGRRISKRFRKGQSDPGTIIASKGSEMVVWDGGWCEKYVYEPGSWNVAMSYFADMETNFYAGPDQSFAWGPDLSGSTGGAGGIGGLAVYTDDDGNTTPGSGSMVPIYDGNGNIVRMQTIDFTPGSSVMAAYEYGPFGEVRSIAGSQGHRNPFRWSTKWSDAETGLVYYGYRYYAPGVGRWCSRDPAQEHTGPNRLSFVGNKPTGSFDPLGLWERNFDWREAGNHSFAGTVTAECGDSYSTLAALITNNPSDAEMLSVSSWPAPEPGDIVDIGVLLQLLDTRLRDGTVSHSQGLINRLSSPVRGIRFWNRDARLTSEDNVRMLWTFSLSRSNNSGRIGLDCSTAAWASMLRSVIDQVRPGEYDAVFPNSTVRKRYHDLPLTMVKHGEHVWFGNHVIYQTYANRDGGAHDWQGESTIKISDGANSLFAAFPLGVQSETEILTELMQETNARLGRIRQRRIPVAVTNIQNINQIPGYDSSKSFFIDVVDLSERLFDHRNRK